MSMKNSIMAAAVVARNLTDSGRRASPVRQSTVVAGIARTLVNTVTPNRVPFGTRVAIESEGELSEVNEIQVGPNAEEVNDHVQDLVRRIQKILFTSRNVVVPTIKTLVDAYRDRQSAAIQPNLAINVLKYHDVHDSLQLLAHIEHNYTRVIARQEYRTFIMNPKSAEQIVTLVSENNPHLDRGQAVDWLLSMGADRITAVWDSLFSNSRVLGSNISYLRESNIPLQIDELLLAYCLCGAMVESPEDVVGESVDLESWKHALGHMHALFGYKLLSAYTQRIRNRDQGVLVIKSDAENAIQDGNVNVLVNGDVYDSWLDRGGDIQALLGAAVYAPNVRTVGAFEDIGENLAEKWKSYYVILRQTCVDRTIMRRHADAVAVMRDTSLPLPEQLPVVDGAEFKRRTEVVLGSIRDEEYKEPYGLFVKLVTGVYYPTNAQIPELLGALDTYSKIHPSATTRELAIEATIEVIASWCAMQIKLEQFTPDVDPSLEHINVGISEGNAEVAESLNNFVTDEPVETTEVPVTEEVVEAGESDTDTTVIGDETTTDEEPEVEETVDGEEPAVAETTEVTEEVVDGDLGDETEEAESNV